MVTKHRPLKKRQEMNRRFASKKTLNAIVFLTMACYFAQGQRSSIAQQPSTIHWAETKSQKTNSITIESGSPLSKIQQAIDTVHARGGGVVILNPGQYTLDRDLDFTGRQNITLIGKGKVTLKAAPQTVTRLAQTVTADARELHLEGPLKVADGMKVEIHSGGRTVVPPAGKPFQTPYIMATVQRAEGTVLHLSQPVKYAAPKGAKVIVVFNGVVIQGDTKNITLQNITLDMNRSQWELAPKNHTYHCALMAQGAYSYDTGPTGPPITGIRIIGCDIKNTHQRGIAFYSVVHSGVYDCRISKTGSEGIDFDHFSDHCQAINNRLTDCYNLEINDASHCLVANNHIIRPSVGVVVWQWCKLPGLNERNLILNNVIIDANSNGIELKSGADFNVVRGNTIKGCGGHGISVAGNHNFVAKNIISGGKDEAIKTTGAGKHDCSMKKPTKVPVVVPGNVRLPPSSSIHQPIP